VLLRQDGESVIAIGQASHAWISGQLARAWFPAPEPREEVCLAAEQHDIGMAEWDLRPTLNPDTGLPHSFLELPIGTHVALWTAAPEKLLRQSTYAALLVSMHGTALQQLRDLPKLTADDRALVLEYLERQRRLQANLAEQLGTDRGELARNQRLLWAWDSLSLALCLRWTNLAVDGSRELELVAPDRFTLDPWPFATGQLDVHCEGRRLMGRFETKQQLHEAFDSAPVVRLEFTLAASRTPASVGVPGK
jgi:Protein of unknown function (DUF3891)